MTLLQEEISHIEDTLTDQGDKTAVDTIEVILRDHGDVRAAQAALTVFGAQAAHYVGTESFQQRLDSYTKDYEDLDYDQQLGLDKPNLEKILRIEAPAWTPSVLSALEGGLGNAVARGMQQVTLHLSQNEADVLTTSLNLYHSNKAVEQDPTRGFYHFVAGELVEFSLGVCEGAMQLQLGLGRLATIN